jgi:polyphosphate kinase
MFELAMSEQISSWALESSGNWVRSQFDSEGNTLSDFQDTIMKSISEPRGK